MTALLSNTQFAATLTLSLTDQRKRILFFSILTFLVLC